MVVVGLGDLGHRVLDGLARCPIGRIVAAGRDPDRAAGLAGQAALIAAVSDGARHVEPAHIDLDDVDQAAATLARLQPSVVVLAASRHTWWRLPEAAAAIPYGAWLPFHVPLTRALMQARAAAGLAAPVVALPYPDAVGPVLAGAGLAPALGAGNVAEVAAKISVLAARRAGVSPGEVDLRLVAHHATERHAFAAFATLGGATTGPQGPPPVRLSVRVAGRELEQEEARELFESPYPLGRGRETHVLTAATTVLAVLALLGEQPRRVHVPAPAGLPGGYPALLSRSGVELDLPEGLAQEDAVAVNEVAARWDGIEQIAADGTVTFATPAVEAVEQVLGLRVERVALEEHDELAEELLARLGRLAGVGATV